MKVWIANRQDRILLRLASFRRLAGKALRQLGRPDAEISVVFVNDYRIRSLNRIYRNKDRVTDVLAFSLSHGALVRGDLPEFLGEVVISAPKAQRQARAAGRSLSSELGWLLVHGILHLSGYDHERPKDALRMRRKERDLLAESPPARSIRKETAPIRSGKNRPRRNPPSARRPR